MLVFSVIVCIRLAVVVKASFSVLGSDLVSRAAKYWALESAKPEFSVRDVAN